MEIGQIIEIEEKLREIFNCKLEYVKYTDKKIEIKFSPTLDDEKIYDKIMSFKKRKYTKQEYKEYVPIENEIWMEMEDYPDVKVSNIGRVMKNNKLVCLKEDKNGYQKVSVRNRNGKTKSVGVHRLVATAFIPNPQNKEQVDHINTIRNDNRAENLRWATPIENILANEITLNRIKQKGDNFVFKMIENALDK